MCMNDFDSLLGRTSQEEKMRQAWLANQQQQRINQQNQSQMQAAQSATRNIDELAAQPRATIAGDTSAIDEAFARFNEPYYANLRTQFIGAGDPGIQRDFARAVDRKTASLAGQGILGSNVAAGAFGDLNREATDARVNLANQAMDFSSQFRDRVEASRQNLYGLSATSTDPSALAAKAYGEATTLANQAAYTPKPQLGNLFAGALAPFAYAASA